MSKKKILYSILFFLIIITATFYSVFSNTSLSSMIENLKYISFGYGTICIVLATLYFVFQGWYTKIIFKSLNVNISLPKGIYYSIIEFFFSGITPSSTGGQPVQIYYMAKDKIPIRKSLIVIILGTIYFKLFMVIFAIIVLLFKWDFIINQGTLFIVLFFLGLVIDSLLIIGCYLLLFHSQAIKKLLTFVYKIKTKLTGKNDENKVNELIENYRKETDYINNHKKEVFVSLILTFFQRIFLFSIAFVIYKAFGFNEYSYIDLLVIQIGVQLAIEGLPLPGGTGVSEHLFNTIFISIFGASLASTGMFLTRLFSFYLPLLVSCVIIIIVTKCCYYKNK